MSDQAEGLEALREKVAAAISSIQYNGGGVVGAGFAENRIMEAVQEHYRPIIEAARQDERDNERRKRMQGRTTA